MDTLDTTTLQIGFGIFFILLILFVLFLRKISVGDIMTPPPPPRSPIRQKLTKQTTRKSSSQKAIPPAPLQSAFPTAQKSTLLATQDKPFLGMDRKKVNAAGKVISAIGAITLFALPDSFTVPSMVIVYAGYMLAKASAPPKEKKTKR